MASIDLIEGCLGRSIPNDTQHAVSVSLPSWRSNVGYEEGEKWVVMKMTTGYPRFFIHRTIQALAKRICEEYGKANEHAMLFPSHKAAVRLVAFINQYDTSDRQQQPYIIDFVPKLSEDEKHNVQLLNLSAVLFNEANAKLAKAFWQHTGEGVSSRRAEYYAKMLENDLLIRNNLDSTLHRQNKGPKRYRTSPLNTNGMKSSDLDQPQISEERNPLDRVQFIEERFGRNLNLNMASRAKTAIKRRICGSLTAAEGCCDTQIFSTADTQSRAGSGLSEDDVYLYPTGMNAIYHAHQTLLAARGPQKSICFGFPYIDTLKILEKFGPGCLFYGNGSSEDIDDLEDRLKKGETFLALFCEFPSNPLLKSPDLQRLRHLANIHNFAIVIDETVGNYLNTHVLPYGDIVVSSLTKVFSGDSNCMGGSAVLNPSGPSYHSLRKVWAAEYEDTYWPEDAVFMERNSRDFVSRIVRINKSAESIVEVLRAHPRVKEVYYPKNSPSRPFYDNCRTANGGYGGLLSATFFSRKDAADFFDNLDTEKGPSLGTNFTLACPFVILAHYTELDWAASFGIDSNLIRLSVGLEDESELVAKVQKALSAITPN